MSLWGCSGQRAQYLGKTGKSDREAVVLEVESTLRGYSFASKMGNVNKPRFGGQRRLYVIVGGTVADTRGHFYCSCGVDTIFGAPDSL